MPRKALPLAFVAFSLVLSLLACASFTPPLNALTTPGRQNPTPGSLPQPSQPPLPNDYEIVSDAFVHLAFALPHGWISVSGTAPGAVYAEYGPPSPAAYPTFRVGADSEPGMTSSPDAVLSSMIPHIVSGEADNMNITADYHTPIAGEEAVVLEYTLTRAPDEAYLSVIAVVVDPDGRGYILQWTSTTDRDEDARDLFNNMVPFFRFLP